MFRCPHCKKTDSVKAGYRKNKSSFIQRYRCNACKRYFVRRDGFERMRTNPDIIVTALDLRAKGLTLGKIRLHLIEKYGKKVTRKTILDWQNKFGEMIENFTKQLKLSYSENAHADEVFLRIKGSKKDEFIYYWDCIDYDTKFILGDHMSNARTDEYAYEFLTKINNMLDKPPEFMHTDCSFDYPRPVKVVFRRKTKHIAKPAWKHGFKNNPIERFHNTLKENYKVLRKYYSIETAYKYLKFFRNYYNFIRPHSSLNWKTPAEIAGFGRFNWWSLIKRRILFKLDIPFN